MNLQKKYILFVSAVFLMACTPQNALISAKVYPVQWFSGFTMVKQLAKEVPVNNQQDVLALLDKRWYSPYKLINTQLERAFSVYSCSQLLPTILQSESYLAYESGTYQYQAAMCVAAQAIAYADPAQYSALSDFKLDADLPRKVPKNLALMISRSQTQKILQNKAIVSWAQAEPVNFVSNDGEYQAKYEMVGAFQTVSLIARGDFNYDGIEDLLLFAQAHVVGGSYTADRLFWITKTDENSPLTLIKEYPPEDRACYWPAC